MLRRATRYLAQGNQALAAVVSGRDVWGEELARMAITFETWRFTIAFHGESDEVQADAPAAGNAG